ncbi:MAG: Glutamine amidotransferase, class I, partial [uncultured Acidimicrobiales bacterium]
AGEAGHRNLRPSPHRGDRHRARAPAHRQPVLRRERGTGRRRACRPARARPRCGRLPVACGERRPADRRWRRSAVPLRRHAHRRDPQRRPAARRLRDPPDPGRDRGRHAPPRHVPGHAGAQRGHGRLVDPARPPRHRTGARPRRPVAGERPPGEDRARQPPRRGPGRHRDRRELHPSPGGRPGRARHPGRRLGRGRHRGGHRGARQPPRGGRAVASGAAGGLARAPGPVPPARRARCGPGPVAGV